MVVGRDYMLKKPSGPSAPKLFLDTKLVPAAVNMLGAAEVALDRLSVRTGLSPRTIVAGAAGLGSFGFYRLLSRWGSGAVPFGRARSAADTRVGGDDMDPIGGALRSEPA
jgi:hypothetical protein